MSGCNHDMKGDPHIPKIVLDFLYGVSALLVSVFCHGLCYRYHILQLNYHLQYKRCLTVL